MFRLFNIYFYEQREVIFFWILYFISSALIDYYWCHRDCNEFAKQSFSHSIDSLFNDWCAQKKGNENAINCPSWMKILFNYRILYENLFYLKFTKKTFSLICHENFPFIFFYVLGNSIKEQLFLFHWIFVVIEYYVYLCFYINFHTSTANYDFNLIKLPHN